MIKRLAVILVAFICCFICNNSFAFTLDNGLYVFYDGSGQGTVSISPKGNGIKCFAAPCPDYLYPAATTVTLMAVPDSSSTFTGWSSSTCTYSPACPVATDQSVACTGTSPVCTFTMSENGPKIATATFSTSTTSSDNFVALMILSSSKPNAGTGVIESNPSGIYCGSECTSIDSITSTSAEWTYCSTVCTGFFKENTVVTLTGIPVDDSTFMGCKVYGIKNDENTCTINMDSAKTVSSGFVQKSCVTDWECGDGQYCAKPAGNCSAVGKCSPYMFHTLMSCVGNPICGCDGKTTSYLGCGSKGPANEAIAYEGACNNTLPYNLIVTKIGKGSGIVKVNSEALVCENNVCQAGSFDENSQVKLSAVADDGSVFDGWSTYSNWIGNSFLTGEKNAILLKMDSMFMKQNGNNPIIAAKFSPAKSGVAVIMTGSGSGTISADGMKCFGTVCAGTYATGSTVTLTAQPVSGANSDSVFEGWTGACAGIGPACTLVMDDYKNATAQFASFASDGITQVALNITKSGTGSGTVISSKSGINCGSACSSSFNTGTSITVTAFPDTGSTFSGWSGACTGTASTCTVTVDSAKTVDAAFTASPATVQHTLSITSDGKGSGTVMSLPAGITCDGSDNAVCDAMFDGNASIQLTAEAGEGSVFTGWTGYDSCKGSSSATCTVVMDADYEITATFEEVSQDASGMTLSVAKSGNGSGKVTSAPKGQDKAISCASDCTDDSAVYGNNKSVTLVAKADKGSKFINWDGDCTGTKTSCKLPMDSDKDVTAIFGKPAVSVSDESVDFGEVAKGQTGSSTVTITNNGDAPLKITSLKITGAGAKMFKVYSEGKAVSKATLQSGDSIDIEVRFKPTLKAAKPAVLQIKSDDPDNPTVSVQLSGEGI